MNEATRVNLSSKQTILKLRPLSGYILSYLGPSIRNKKTNVTKLPIKNKLLRLRMLTAFMLEPPTYQKRENKFQRLSLFQARHDTYVIN